MTIRIIAAAVCATIGMGAAGVAIAQAVWPTITSADAEICRNVITQAHRAEHDFIRADIQDACVTNPQGYAPSACGIYRDGLAESQAMDPVAWYMKGNGRCEGSDYPCFGPAVYNTPRSGADARKWADIFAKEAANPATVTPGMELWDVASIADNCIAGVWLKKYNAAGGHRVFADGGAPAASPAPAAPAAPAAPMLISAADPAFNAYLQSYQPDQLVALAQELLTTGQIDLAKLARNALLARFPDSPLVPVMVDMLLRAPAAAPAQAAVAAPAASAPPAPSATQRFIIRNSADLAAAFAQAGYTLNARASGNGLVDSQNQFFVAATDCGSGVCDSLQIWSDFRITPTPSRDRINQWNREKLYGRAFASGESAIFDMTILIPSTGLELTSLREHLDLYLDAAAAYYDYLGGQ